MVDTTSMRGFAQSLSNTAHVSSYSFAASIRCFRKRTQYGRIQLRVESNAIEAVGVDAEFQDTRSRDRALGAGAANPDSPARGVLSRAEGFRGLWIAEVSVHLVIFLLSAL